MALRFCHLPRSGEFSIFLFRMIAHQHPRMHKPAMASADLLQPVQKRLVVLLPHKNPLPAVTTRHDVANSACILKPRWPSHAVPRTDYGSESMFKSKD